MSQGAMAEDLYGLYAYMDERVWDASLTRDVAPLEEVMTLMLTIKSVGINCRSQKSSKDSR